MQRVASLWRIVHSAFRGIRYKIEMRHYDEFTIAEHFRRQGARIGENTRICVTSLGTEPYLVRIGDDCLISTLVAFETHDGGVSVFRREFPTLQRFGTIEILDNCMIGTKATILSGVRIGPNSVVGACSVVTKDVPPGVIVAGSPARPVSTLESYREKVLREWGRQEPDGYMPEVRAGGEFPPAYIHALKRRDEKVLREHLMRVLWGDQGEPV